MRKIITKYWNLGWWTAPAMVFMASPWLPLLNDLWGSCLSQAKEAMKLLAPVVTILVIGGQAGIKPVLTHKHFGYVKSFLYSK